MAHGVLQERRDRRLQTGAGRACRHDHEQPVGSHAGGAGRGKNLESEVHNSMPLPNRRMLFDTSLRKELARSFGATLVVILTIVLTMMLIRTLGQAAGGVIAPQDVVLLLGYTGLGQLPTMLALSLFIAIVVTLGRMYRDSEMAIWFASGIGLPRFVRPVLRMSWPVLLVVALLVLIVWPWGNRQSLELRDRYEQRSDLSRVAPGVFQSSRDGNRVFFVEREHDETVSARNVFILSKDGERESVTSARSGRLVTEGDDRFVVLDRGQRNESDAARGIRSQATFESYRILASERAVRSAEARPPRATRTIDLLRAAHACEPRRADLALRPALRRRQPAAARHRPVGHQPAPREQLEPALRAARLRRLLQPHQPHADLGGERPHRHGHRAAGAARRHVRGRARAALVARPRRRDTAAARRRA